MRRFPFPPIVVVLMLSLPVPAHACSCISSPIDEALAGATEVFTGRVTAVKNPYAGAVIQSSMDPLSVTMSVDRVWKGTLGRSVELRTANSGASCGYRFDANEIYLVFAHDRHVSLCSRTKPIATATEDLAALGDSHVPENAAFVPQPSPTASPREPDAIGYERCPDGVRTVTEPFSGFLDMPRLVGTYDMGCEECTITRCDVTPREGPVVTRYASGQIHIQGFYRQGRREGSWASWYANGQRHYEAPWRHDRKHGLWRVWRDGGQLEAEMEYADDVPDGAWRLWYANGQQHIDGGHRRGARTGTWRYWNEDGSLLAEGPGGAASGEP